MPPHADPPVHSCRPLLAPARTAALLAASLPLLAACGAGDAPVAERVDSAGVVLVTSPGEDRPLPWTFEPELTIGGDDFYRVGRWNVDADAGGTVHVLDPDGKRILRYRPDGTPLPALGAPGSGPGELEWPNLLEVSEDGRVSVTDFGRGRLITWAPDGSLLGEEPIADPGRMFRHLPGGEVRTVDMRGRDESGTRLVVVPPSGDTTELARVTWTGRPIQLESCGMGFSGMPPIFTPSLRWDAAASRIAVVEGAEYDIRVSDGGDPSLRVRRRLTAPEPTREMALVELGEGMSVMVQGARRVCDPAEVVEQRGLAPRAPLVEALTVEPGGRMWVQRFVPGDDPGPIDVFGPDGEYIGTIAAGAPLPLRFLPDGRALTSQTDELDVQRLVIGRFVEGGAERSGG